MAKTSKKTAARKTSKTPAAAKAAKPAKVKAEAPNCYCGCGKVTGGPKRRFLQGHDARLHSIFLKVCKGEISRTALKTDRKEVADFIAGAKWATPELMKAFRAAK